MNVLFVNEKCGYFGGVEQNVADSAIGLRGRGHRCHLAYGTRTDHDPGGYSAAFDSVHPCAELSPNRRGEPFAALLARLECDVVYFNKVAELPCDIRSLSRVRAVRMVHDHDLCCPRRHKYFLWSGRVCRHRLDWRCAMDGAFVARDRDSHLGVVPVSLRAKRREMTRNQALDCVLVGSRFMRDELLQNGFDSRSVHILPPAVPVNGTLNRAVPNEHVILFVGQLIRGKGVDLLLRALSEVTCPFLALIAGDGAGRGRLETLSGRLGLGRRVRFLGWVAHERLSELYAAAKVVVVPSRWPEPFGMIGLEAMHNGRGVIAFRVGGIPDWIVDGRTGLLVDEQDTHAMARAIEEVLANGSVAAQLGANARQHVQRRFSFQAYLGALEGYLSGAQRRDT